MRNKAFLIIVISFLILVVGSIGAYSRFRNGRNTLPPQYYKSQTSQTTSVAPFDHIFIILEENKPQASIIGNRAAPYINLLANKYARSTNYYGVTNPSLPNYIALTSGTTAGITNDCNPPGTSCEANVPNITDRLGQAGKTWKAYMESMPQPCHPNNSGQYAVKHDPFMYYPDIRNNNARCTSHVVPFNQLSIDISSAATTPNYAFITPNMCNDMHDCPIQTGDTWLSRQVPKILTSPAFAQQHSLLAIVWDEGNNSNNNVPVIFAGPAAKQSFISNGYYSHYSLLHTIENSWKLQPLIGNDASAPLMTDMLH